MSQSRFGSEIQTASKQKDFVPVNLFFKDKIFAIGALVRLQRVSAVQPAHRASNFWPGEDLPQELSAVGVVGEQIFGVQFEPLTGTLHDSRDDAFSCDRK